MGGKTAIALGLLAGIAVGGALVGGFVALSPVPASPAAPATAGPTEVPSAAAPTEVPSAAASPSASVLPSASATPSDPPSAAPPASPDASASPASASPSSPPASPSGGPSTGPSAPAAALGIGQPAPALRLPKLGGGTLDIVDLRGRPVWVAFIASDCQPCVNQLSRMRGLEERYRNTGLRVLLVDVREDRATVSAFLETVGVTFPTALDAAGEAQAAWGAATLPAHVWVDGDGKVRDLAQGAVGPGRMARGLGSILPGETVTP